MTSKLPIFFLNNIFNNIANRKQKSDFTFLILGGGKTTCVYWQKALLDCEISDY